MQVLNRDEVFRELHSTILHQLEHGALTAKQHAAQVLAEHFCSGHGGRQIGELYRRLVLDFCCGESCWQRAGFLLFCKAGLQCLDPQ